MQRETKVGLLVGLGVILLVGIILSDTLSPVQKQSPAAMETFASRAQRSYTTQGEEPSEMPIAAIPDAGPGGAAALPESVGPMTRRDPIALPNEDDLPPAMVAPPPAHDGVPVDPEALPLAQRRTPIATATEGDAVLGTHTEDPIQQVPVSPGHAFVNTTPGEVRLLGPQRQDIPAGQGGYAETLTPQPKAMAVHVVQAGDTFYRLGHMYYKDASSWKLIEQANSRAIASNGGKLKIGTTLVIPRKQAESGLPEEIKKNSLFEPVDAARAPGASDGVPLRVVEVKAGDTLMGLAQKHLGSKHRWRELLDANKDVLRKPEDLKLGTRLRVPAAASSTAPPASAAAVATTPSAPADAAPTASGAAMFGSTTTSSAAGAPAATIVATAPVRTYTVQAGDTPAAIAARTLGNKHRWPEIMEANRGKVAGPSDLKIGQVLNIPVRASR